MPTGMIWDSVEYPASVFCNMLEELLMGLGAATQCVLRGVGDEFVASGTTSPVVVGSGAAYAKGRYRRWTGTTNVVIPTPTTATRIDRIVIEVDYSEKTVEIARVGGTEGGGAPTLTQIDGTLWQSPLWQVTITTSGAITLTDERGFIQSPVQVITAMLVDGILSADATGRAKMADGFVSTAKLANNALSADATGRAKMADGFVTNAKLSTGARWLPGMTMPFASTVASLGGTDGRRLVIGGITYNSWVYCDGGAPVNGYNVPDYRGRVVACTDGSHAAGTTGGANTAGLAHTHGKGTLATANTLGYHNHSINSDGVHAHILAGGTQIAYSGSGVIGDYTHDSPAHNHGGLTGSANLEHNHDISGATDSALSSAQDIRQPTIYQLWFMYVGE